MIKVYPTEVEAIDDNNTKVFTMMMVDAEVATIELNTSISLSEDGLNELFGALQDGLKLLIDGGKE